MAVANFLASSHQRDVVSNITDVADFITALRTILCTDNDPVWTEPTAGTFKSPIDADGRWFSVLVEAIDADTLQYTVKDQYGTTIRVSRQDITTTGSGTELRVFSGQYHLWTLSMRTTPEVFMSGMLDLSPRAQTAWNSVVYSMAYRASNGAVSGDRYNMSISGEADQGYITMTPPTPGYGGYATPTDNGGDTVYWPLFMRSKVTSNSGVLLGRAYQVLIVPTTLSEGAQVIVPTDVGVTATFEVATKSLTGSFNWANFLMAIRAD